MTARWARSYLLTGGRTGSSYHLDTHTLVSAAFFDRLFRGPLPESRALYEAAATYGPVSIAELSAFAGVPLGVARVLLGDLVQSGHVVVNQNSYAPLDLALLERLRDGLVKL